MTYTWMYRGLGMHLLSGCVGISQHQLFTRNHFRNSPWWIPMSQSQFPGDQETSLHLLVTHGLCNNHLRPWYDTCHMAVLATKALGEANIKKGICLCLQKSRMFKLGILKKILFILFVYKSVVSWIVYLFIRIHENFQKLYSFLILMIVSWNSTWHK